MSPSFHVPITLNPLQTNKCFGAPGTCQVLTPSAYSETNKIWCLLWQQFNGAPCIATRVKFLPFLTTDGGCRTWPQRINHPYKNGLAKWLRRRSSPTSIIKPTYEFKQEKIVSLLFCEFCPPLNCLWCVLWATRSFASWGERFYVPLAKLSLSKSYLPSRDQGPSPGY